MAIYKLKRKMFHFMGVAMTGLNALSAGMSVKEIADTTRDSKQTLKQMDQQMAQLKQQEQEIKRMKV